MRRAFRYENDKVKEQDFHDYDEYEWGERESRFLHNVMNQYHNKSVTENGALGYETTSDPLVDLNFKVSSLRSKTKEYIVKEFIKAYYALPEYAVKWLFFIRDITEGLGERRTFRICLQYLAEAHPNITLKILKLIPEYGRYDDYLCLLDTGLCDTVCCLLKEQLEKDLNAIENKEPVSLLAKWIPSINASSHKSRETAKLLIQKWGMSEKKYCKILSALRKYLDIVEVKMTDSRWNEIIYEKVPAKANLLYDHAFAEHDEERRADYLYKVLQGNAKLNGKGIMPYEIVHRFVKERFFSKGLKDDLTAELMWKCIREQEFENEWGLEDCIVVADGSGSMYQQASGTSSVMAIEICMSLAIYFSEQLKGIFHNKAITFSATPQFIDLEKGDGIKEKIEIMSAYNEVANTNIEAVFDLLLAVAMDNNVPQEILPKQVLIISDMEFDRATGYVGFNQTLFETVEEKYKSAGYQMPRLIFWNVCGRTNTIPKVDNEQGCCLLSGFSQNAVKVAANMERKSAYENLIEVLDSPRYEPVKEALKGA